MSDLQAYEHNGERIGRERFYAIACDPRRHVAVEACAGAGKTWVLVSRMLRALLDGAQPHEILAITFTKKAAGEMRLRLHDWLARFADASPQQLDQALTERGIGLQPTAAQRDALKNLYRTLLASGRPVQIRTFHSWFAALLRSAPLAVLEQLGLPAQYDLLEDDSEAVAGVWRRFHAAVAAEPAALADFNASVAAHGRSQTRKALLAVLAKRVEFDLADRQGVVDASVRLWTQVFPEFAGATEPVALLSGAGPVHDTLTAAAVALCRASAPTFSALGRQLQQALSKADLPAALAALLTQKGEPRKFTDKLAGLDRVREAQALATQLSAAHEQHQGWLHHNRMARLARLLIVEFAAHKRERRWIDMNDVERAALAMLADPVLSGWVQERLDVRIRHLLIDEFQDTNPLQWQALYAWLGSYAGAGGTGPSVFIVGDPKQSIYRFRRAEPQVFRAAQSFVVEGLGGDLLSCDHTHRNAPALMAVINAVMTQAQEEGRYDGFRRHTTESVEAGSTGCLPQIARLQKEAVVLLDTPLAWRDTLVVAREQPEEKLVTLECAQAAAWIAAQLAAGTRAGDIMVLARKRDRLAAMEGELRALRVPAQQPEKTDLHQAPEVQDLVALLDVLVSPGHDLSLARVLKSPLFGLQDSSLVEIALLARQARQHDRPSSWFGLLQDDRQLAPGLRETGVILARWRRWVDRLPPYDALAAIYHDGDVMARFAQAAPGPMRAPVLANLQALLGAALQIDGSRFATPYAFVRALKRGDVRAPAPADAEAVRLLTVHGAKGLEAPVVLLLDTDGPAMKAETMGVIVEWPGEAPAPLRFAFIAGESKPPTCNAAAVEVERNARQREELNALDVAMTRARCQLVLSSVQPHAAAGASWWQRLQPFCTALPAPPAAISTAQGAVLAAASFDLPVVPDLR